jgi:uncharacterized protein DUF664
MTEIDEHGRPEPPVAADETATLLGFLDFQRATLAWKCSGLDAAGLRAMTAASTMTLGGILKHMALVESVTHSTFRSQWREEHEDLIAVAIGESQRARPAPDLLPAKPAVEALEAFAAASFQAQLL